MLGDVKPRAFPVGDSRTLTRFGIYGILGIEALGRAEVSPVVVGHECVGLISKGGAEKEMREHKENTTAAKRDLYILLLL